MIRLKMLYVCLFALALPLLAQSSESQSEYRFLNAQASGTLEKELNQNAAEGWRLLLLPKAYGSSTMGALLKKSGNTEVKYEYKVLAASRIGTLENEFKAMVNEGYDFRRGVARNVDLVARVGGEEFAMVLPHTPVEVAQVAAARLCEGVAGLHIAVPDGQMLQFTASFGVAQARGTDNDLPALMHRADLALYRAKALGRNRVELAA